MVKKFITGLMLVAVAMVGLGCGSSVPVDEAGNPDDARARRYDKGDEVPAEGATPPATQGN